MDVNSWKLASKPKNFVDEENRFRDLGDETAHADQNDEGVLDNGKKKSQIGMVYHRSIVLWRFFEAF